MSESPLLVDEREPVSCTAWGFHPIPDSLRIEDLIGSGEFERRRLRIGLLKFDMSSEKRAPVPRKPLKRGSGTSATASKGVSGTC